MLNELTSKQKIEIAMEYCEDKYHELSQKPVGIGTQRYYCYETIKDHLKDIMQILR